MSPASGALPAGRASRQVRRLSAQLENEARLPKQAELGTVAAVSRLKLREACGHDIKGSQKYVYEM